MGKTKKKTQNGKSDKIANGGEVETSTDLKAFLLNVRDRMNDASFPPVFSLSGMNYVLQHQKIYELLDDENKEIARDIWLRLRTLGLQVDAPPLLFKEGELEALSAA